MSLSLYIQEVSDYFLRENFRKTKDFIGLQQILNGDLKLYEIVITGNKTNFIYAHNQKFIPKDVVQTSAVFSAGVGAVVWNYSLFDGTYLNLTTSGMGSTDTCTVRALVGRFQ